MSRTLTACLEARNLVSLHRNGIGGYGIQGFLVGISEELLAIEYVYDFQVDGLMILRRSDISGVVRTGTDEFQERLLKKDGIHPGGQLPPSLQLNGWKSVIEQIAQHHPLIILERELGPTPEFAIGRVVRTTAKQVELNTFSGTGKWYAKAERLKYSQITCLQVNTRYLNYYQRYFDCEAT